MQNCTLLQYWLFTIIFNSRETFMNTFPIGFWNYTRTGQLGIDAVHDWKDLGMSFAMSPEFYPDIDDKKIILAMLDECEKLGLRMLICDARVRWHGASSDPEGYRARFRAAYEDFGRHPACMGFHIGDEPADERAFADCIQANKIQLEIAPELVPFVNFLPYRDGIEKSILHTDTFEEWAESMAKNADLKLLSYDCYTQMNPEIEGMDRYFKNLRKFSSAAAASGIPVWTTLLSVGHFRYREPNENDLRWQLSTAAACGCKGIMWFFVYLRYPHGNYRKPPIDEFWERTETFGWLSRVNRNFQHRFGQFFLNAELKKTWMIEKSFGGYPLLEGKVDEFIDSIESVHGLPAIVSLYERDGDKYICLVSNTPLESGLFRIHFNKKVKKVDNIEWDGLRDMKYHEGGYFEIKEDELVAGDWFCPGQMQVYRYSE